MILSQLTAPLVRACATNASSTGFTAKTAGVTTKPSGNLVYPVAEIGYEFRSRMRLWPIGVGSENDAFSIRIWGWNRSGSGNGAGGIIWLASILGEFSCTLGKYVGVANSPVLATERFADTITVVSEPTTRDGELTPSTDAETFTTQGTTEIFSPANDTPGWVELRLRGAELLEFDFDQTTGTPTMNALLQFLGGPK